MHCIKILIWGVYQFEDIDTISARSLQAPAQMGAGNQPNAKQKRFSTLFARNPPYNGHKHTSKCHSCPPPPPLLASLPLPSYPVYTPTPQTTVTCMTPQKQCMRHHAALPKRPLHLQNCCREDCPTFETAAYPLRTVLTLFLNLSPSGMSIRIKERKRNAKMLFVWNFVTVRPAQCCRSKLLKVYIVANPPHLLGLQRSGFWGPFLVHF